MAATIDAGNASLQTTRRSARYYVQREEPAPLSWAGVLPALGLAALFAYAAWIFAPADIEATVRTETRAALAAKGHDWAQVKVDGQNVFLTGVQPKPGAGDDALATARAATCPSGFGRLPCPVVVLGQFMDSPAVAVPPVAASVAAAPAAANVAAPAPAAAAATAAPAVAVACEKSLAAIVQRSQIEFASGSATISPRSGAVLDALAAAARECDLPLTVEGHTDAIGAPAANQALSAARAGAVAAALEARGVPKARLVPQGFGAGKPIGDNATEAGRARNRRIEFHVATDKKN